MTAFTLGEPLNALPTPTMETPISRPTEEPTASFTLGEPLGALSFGDKAQRAVVETGEAIGGAVGTAFEYTLTTGANAALGAIDFAVDTAPKVRKGVSQAFLATQVAGSPVLHNAVYDVIFSARSQKSNYAGADLFSPETLDVLGELVVAKGLLPGQSINIGQEVYGEMSEAGSLVSVATMGGASAGSIVESLATRNPRDEIKLMLGAFTATADSEGNITVSDRFNYNYWNHPVTGEKYTPQEYDKALADGDFTTKEMIALTLKTHGANYATARSLGFLMGSRDYGPDDERTKGRFMEANIGNLETFGGIVDAPVSRANRSGGGR